MDFEKLARELLNKAQHIKAAMGYVEFCIDLAKMVWGDEQKPPIVFVGVQLKTLASPCIIKALGADHADLLQILRQVVEAYDERVGGTLGLVQAQELREDGNVA